jgi:hypothetical protein
MKLATLVNKLKLDKNSFHKIPKDIKIPRDINLTKNKNDNLNMDINTDVK